jgi:hypothetical protein
MAGENVLDKAPVPQGVGWDSLAIDQFSAAAKKASRDWSSFSPRNCFLAILLGQRANSNSIFPRKFLKSLRKLSGAAHLNNTSRLRFEVSKSGTNSSPRVKVARGVPGRPFFHFPHRIRRCFHFQI